MTNTAELKNCPFCGSSNIAEMDCPRTKGGDFYQVCCNNNDCLMDVHVFETSPELARKAWNTRSDEPKAGVVERFSELVSQIPIGEESVSLGASAYNWGQHYLKWLRKIVSLNEQQALKPQPVMNRHTCGICGTNLRCACGPTPSVVERLVEALRPFQMKREDGCEYVDDDDYYYMRTITVGQLRKIDEALAAHDALQPVQDAYKTVSPLNVSGE